MEKKVEKERSTERCGEAQGKDGQKQEDGAGSVTTHHHRCGAVCACVCMCVPGKRAKQQQKVHSVGDEQRCRHHELVLRVRARAWAPAHHRRTRCGHRCAANRLHPSSASMSCFPSCMPYHFFFFLRGKSLLAGNSYVEAGPLRLCPCAATPHTHTHKYTQIHAQRDPSRVKTNPLYAAHLPIRLAFLFFFQGFGTGELDGVLADYVGPNIVLNSMYL